MKRAEIELPEPLFEQVEGAARRLHMTVPQFLQRAAEKAVAQEQAWEFPAPPDLGELLLPPEAWRLIANERDQG